MKKILSMALLVFALQACNDHDGEEGESGVVNDGYNGISDPNGGLSDTLNNPDPAIDSARWQDRVDTEKRLPGN